MKICFYSNQLGERGTETSIIDYAAANREILGNESCFAFPKERIFCQERYERLRTAYDIFLFETVDELAEYLNASVDLFYIQVDGAAEDIVDQLGSRFENTFVHCVFSTKRKHGKFYCPIHNFLNETFRTSYPVLPLPVLPLPVAKATLREELHIPADAIVYGGYGGKDRFNIDFVQKTVIRIARENPNIFFIFMNFEDFVSKLNHAPLENIIFLPGSTDVQYKSRFIETTNAMLHARADGETFGLAVAEFSAKNKPVITYAPDFKDKVMDRIKKIRHRLARYSTAHLENLGEKGIVYSNAKQLAYILTHFSEWYTPSENYDCFTERFSPQNVMAQFQKIISE